MWREGVKGASGSSERVAVITGPLRVRRMREPRPVRLRSSSTAERSMRSSIRPPSERRMSSTRPTTIRYTPTSKISAVTNFTCPNSGRSHSNV